jgi:hypothetical protein
METEGGATILSVVAVIGDIVSLVLPALVLGPQWMAPAAPFTGPGLVGPFSGHPLPPLVPWGLAFVMTALKNRPFLI